MAQKRYGPTTRGRAGVQLGGEHLPHNQILFVVQRWATAIVRYLGSWSSLRLWLRQLYCRSSREQTFWAEIAHV